MRLQRHDLHTLTGSYALDALQGEELAEFERHLNHCPSCTSEVRGLRATAARLALATAERPPATMRGRVLTMAEADPAAPAAHRRAARAAGRQPPGAPGPPGLDSPVLRGRRRPERGRGRGVRDLAPGISERATSSDSIRSQLASAEAHNHALSAVLAASDAHLVSSAYLARRCRHRRRLAGQGKLVVVTSGLPALPASKVYELWLLGTSVAKPSGLLSGPQNGQTDPVLADGLVAGYKLGITVEPAGGTLKPTTAPISTCPCQPDQVLARAGPVLEGGVSPNTHKLGLM